MRYLVDINLISKQDNNPKVRNWVIQHYLQLAVSSITVAELVQGIEALPAAADALDWKRCWKKC